MSTKSQPFYWLECDAPDCESQWPGDGGEVSAYSSADVLGYATYSDWLAVAGKDFCQDHANWHCRECGQELTEDEQNHGEYECFKCLGD